MRSEVGWPVAPGSPVRTFGSVPSEGFAVVEDQRLQAPVRQLDLAASDTLHCMKTRGVDPRDQTWEIEQPTYRVHFHDADGASEEYEVEDGDAREVLAWADAVKGNRTFVLYACVPRDGLGLLRLQGRESSKS